jgi:hypothetical protein
MAELNPTSAQPVLTGSKMMAVIVATGAVFGFALAMLADYVLATDEMIVMTALGLSLGGLGGAFVYRFLGDRLR